MFLDQNTFSSIIKNTPLISIDLIVKNEEDKVLLGKRVNEPACGFWFVPGGRIFKNETLASAFHRIALGEVGLEDTMSQAKFHGLYEHFYDNNVFDGTFGTHYIVLSYEIKSACGIHLNNQHEEYKWFDIDELLESNEVHKYTKDYFKEQLQ